MKTKESMLEPLFLRQEAVTKAIEIAEDEIHVLHGCIDDILDEVGDILHDDLRFKNRIINRALVKPKIREKIKAELVTFIIRQ